MLVMDRLVQASVLGVVLIGSIFPKGIVYESSFLFVLREK